MRIEVATGQLANPPKSQERGSSAAGVHRQRIGYLALEKSSRRDGMLKRLALPELKSLAETESHEQYHSVITGNGLDTRSMPARTGIFPRHASRPCAFHCGVLGKLVLRQPGACTLSADRMRARFVGLLNTLQLAVQAVSSRPDVRKQRIVLVNVKNSLGMMFVGTHHHKTAVNARQASLVWFGRRN